METIHLPASIDQLDKVNKILEQTLTGSLSKMLLKTQLVVEELLANICSYAYEGQKGGSASFACGVVNFDGHKSILIQLKDSGKPYDPFEQSKAPDLNAPIEDRPIGGLGVLLVKEIASHYSYVRIDGCNQTQIFLNVETII